MSSVKLSRIVLSLGVALLTGEAAVRIAANFLPEVQYLSTVRVKSRLRHHATLEAFLKAQTTHLVPYRNWRNYFNNSLGFNDAEFEIPKPPCRYRIVALGDSFCFSMAPYTDAALTLVERQLGLQCGRDLDLLNAGIAATTPWEYRTLFDLMLPVWQPDAVVLHFYLGNDGPDLFKHRNQLPFREEPLFHSAFLTYVRNAVRLLRSREASAPAPISPRRSRQARAVEKGGEIVDPSLPPVTDRDPSISGPVFTAEAFRKIMADELGRLYVPEEGVERDWEPIVKILDDMRRAAERAGVRFVMVLYPSQLQVYPDFRRKMLAEVTAQSGYRRLAVERIDPLAPNRYLLGWCARTGVACFDLTPSLAREAPQQTRPLYIERDPHWNILGNRLAAAGESAFLERELCPREAGGLSPDKE
jgi:hypothetical protein